MIELSHRSGLKSSSVERTTSTDTIIVLVVSSPPDFSSNQQRSLNSLTTPFVTGWFFDISRVYCFRCYGTFPGLPLSARFISSCPSLSYPELGNSECVMSFHPVIDLFHLIIVYGFWSFPFVDPNALERYRATAFGGGTEKVLNASVLHCRIRALPAAPVLKVEVILLLAYAGSMRRLCPTATQV